MSYEQNFILIESAQNERLKHAIKLMSSNNSLRQSGLAAAEGLHLAECLMRQKEVEIESVWLPKSLLNNPEWLALAATSPCMDDPQINFIALADHLYSKLSKLSTPTGPMIFFRPFDGSKPIDLSQDMVMLDGIQDPGNMGTLLRNCAAAGVQQVVVSDHCAWVWSDKVLRAGMGAQFSLHIHSEADLLKALKDKKQVPIRATSLHSKSTDLFETDLKSAGIWVFGSEGQGVSQAWLDRASQHIRIPQSPGVESLNVGSSSAVCLFEQVRQRR